MLLLLLLFLPSVFGELKDFEGGVLLTIGRVGGIPVAVAVAVAVVVADAVVGVVVLAAAYSDER